MKKTIHNVETGEIKEVTMTAEEIAEIENFASEIETARNERQNAKEAVLTKLGVTAEELSAALA